MVFGNFGLPETVGHEWLVHHVLERID